MSGSRASSAANAPSTMPWSSASTVRILMSRDLLLRYSKSCRHALRGHRDRERGAAVHATVDTPTERGDALAHARQPGPVGCAGTASVVGDGQAHVVAGGDDLDAAHACVGVAHDVR